MVVNIAATNGMHFIQNNLNFCIAENSINAFKRKMSLANEEAAKQKMAKLEDSSLATPEETAPPVPATDAVTQPEAIETTEDVPASAPVTDAKAGNDLSPTDTAPNKDEKPEEGAASAVEMKLPNQAIANVVAEENANSPLRRGSQESTATTTTQTTTTTGSDSTDSSSDSSSTDSSTSDSDDSSSEDDANKVNEYIQLN